MSSNPRPTLKKLSFNKPTPDTKFYVDYDWWQESNLDLNAYLFRHLSLDQNINLDPELEEVDLIDPNTGEVRRVQGFEYMVQTHFSQLSKDYIASASFVDAVFCVLLANGNKPMTARDIAERVQRSTDVVLKTLAGPTIYKGIRPIWN